jgi:hypothetical protein
MLLLWGRKKRRWKMSEIKKQYLYTAILIAFTIAVGVILAWWLSNVTIG